MQMKTVPALIAAALALATVPSASNAQDKPTAAIGVAFQSENNRVKVAEVMPGGPGDLMGVRPGDILTHAGGKRINSPAKLSAFMRSLKVGDPVDLTVTRAGKSLKLTGTAMARQW
jgi:putative serine protease PepD